MQHRLSRDQVIWSFGPDLEPVLEVEPGETVVFETNDCFTGQIRSEDDLVTEIDLERINGATGPVAVKGADGVEHSFSTQLALGNFLKTEYRVPGPAHMTSCSVCHR